MSFHFRKLIVSNNLVQRSLTVEHKLDETLALAVGAETGQRGYVIIGNEVFLEPYYAAISSTNGIIPHLQELRRLTYDNPLQQEQLDKLDTLVREKLVFMKKVTDVRRNAGFEAAKELIATEIGRQMMLDVRHELFKMHDNEQVLVQKRLNDVATNFWDTVFAMIMGLGSGFSLLLFLFIVVNRETAIRKHTEEVLQQLNKELERQVEERVEELRKNEEQFKTMLESVKDYAIFMLNANGDVLSWNSGAELLKGYKAEEIIGKNFSCFFPEEDILAGKPAVLLKTATEQNWAEDEGWRVRKDGTRFFADVVMSSIYNEKHQLTGFAKVTRDITDRKQNELKISYLSRMYATLSQVNQAIVRIKDKNELFKTICRVAVEYGKFGLAWIGLLDNDTDVVTPTDVYGAVESSFPYTSINLKESPFNNGIIGKAAETGNVVYCENIQTDPAMLQWREMATIGGFHAAASVPIREQGVVVAFLNIYASEVDFFSKEEIPLLNEMGSDVSFALDTMCMSALQKQTAESLKQSEKHFRDMFEGHSAIMLIIDPDNNVIIDANQAATAFYGWSVDELRHKPIQEISALTPEQVHISIKQSRTGEKNYFLSRHRRGDGTIRDVEIFTTTIETDGKDSLYTIIHDVTERKHYEIATALHISLLEMEESHSIEELLQMTLDEAERLTESSIGFFHFVSEDQVTLSLQAWSTNTEKNMCKVEEAVTHYALNSAGVWADAARERKAVIHNDYSAVKDRKGMPEGHAEIRREIVVPVLRGDKVVAILGVGNKLAKYDENDIKWVGILADTAWDIVAKKMGDEERKILQAQKYAIEHLAMHDSLTGLPNRRLLSERINLTIALCRRSKTKAALMIFDLDKFKPVNDTFGHGIGDLLLQEVANRIMGILLRSGDTLARLGGDEFVVLLPQITANLNAVALAETIKNAILQPFEVEGHPINISCSIGISVFPDHGDNELELMRHADEAMYRAKNEGRNRVLVYEGEIL